VILLITSILFILTVLGYLASSLVLEPNPARPRPGAASVAVAEWLDHKGPWALGVEFVVMLVAGTLAMVTDPWFSPRSKTRKREGES
jgi:hypothetical protein